MGFKLLLSLLLLVGVSAGAQTNEREDQLARIDVVKNDAEAIVLVRDSEEFRIPSPQDEEAVKRLQDLIPQDREAFFRNRATAMEKMLSLFHWRHLKEGKGAIVGRRIIQDQVQSILTAEDGPQSIRGEVLEMFQNELIEKQKQAGGESLYARNLAKDLVIEKLKAIDGMLHEYPGVIAKPGEIGFSFAVGLGALIGAKTNVRGGARLIGFNIGIDWQTKSLVFEVSRIKEKVAKTITPIAVNVQIPVNVGIYAKNGNFRGSHVGSTIYTPGIPIGVSGYSNYVEMGLMFGYPPIIFDFFGWQSDATRDRILRIEISPFRLGFLKVELGTTIKSSLVSVKDMVKRWFSPRGGPSCRRLYTAS